MIAEREKRDAMHKEHRLRWVVNYCSGAIYRTCCLSDIIDPPPAGIRPLQIHISSNPSRTSSADCVRRSQLLVCSYRHIVYTLFLADSLHLYSYFIQINILNPNGSSVGVNLSLSSSKKPRV